MTHNNIGLHHLNVRKRIYKKHEPYPHPDKWKGFMDKAIYFAVFLGPLMTIPQIVKIWVEKNAAGVSLVSWLSYMVVALFWLMYGITHKDKPIMFTNAMWFLLQMGVVSGIFMYG